MLAYGPQHSYNSPLEYYYASSIPTANNSLFLLAPPIIHGSDIHHSSEKRLCYAFAHLYLIRSTNSHTTMPWNSDEYRPRADRYGAAYYGLLEDSQSRPKHGFGERLQTPEPHPRASRRSDLSVASKRNPRAITLERSQTPARRAISEAPLHNKHCRSYAQPVSSTSSHTRRSNGHGQCAHEPGAAFSHEVSPSRNFPKNLYYNVFNSLRKSLPRPRLPHAAPPISRNPGLHVADSTYPSRSTSMHPTHHLSEPHARQSSVRRPPQRPSSLAYSASSSVPSYSPSRSSVRGQVGDLPYSDAPAAKSRVASVPGCTFP